MIVANSKHFNSCRPDSANLYDACLRLHQRGRPFHRGGAFQGPVTARDASSLILNLPVRVWPLHRGVGRTSQAGLH